MSIEFSCSQCGQNLRVSEESAGKRAKCPKCSHVNQIPEPTSLLDDGLGGLDDADYNLAPAEPPKGVAASPFSSGGPPPPANPYASPQTGFGPTTQAGGPFGKGGIGNVRVDIGSILNYSIDIWKINLGLLVGATVVLIAISWGLAIGQNLVSEVLRRAGQPEMGAVIDIVGAFASQAVQIYLGIGVAQLMLKLARHQRAEFSDVFAGGPRFLPVLGVSILLGLAIMGGLILLIIPGIIVALMWWPCYYLVVDNKAGVMESFGMARTVTEGNLGTTFLMWVVGFGIGLLGLLACCIGIIFAVPLVGTMYVVAYLMMSGQIPLQPGISQSKTLG